jgi:Cu/Zn superoxide dismutase
MPQGGAIYAIRVYRSFHLPDGRLQAAIVAKGVTLGDGPNSLFHPGGTALAIDENPDDYKTEPDWNSDPHVACGVIQRDGAAKAP